MKFSNFLIVGIIISIFSVIFLSNFVESKPFDPNHNISIAYDECIVPDCVEIGDILFIDMALYQESEFMIPGPYNEHTALYIGNNEFIHASGDAHSTVCIRNYSRFYHCANNLAFVRVKTANISQRQAAVDWSLKQLGKSFQDYLSFSLKDPWFDIKCHNPNWWWFPEASKWYCAELPWAAYYNQGIDIDRNGWRRDKLGPFPAVAIRDIIEDEDTEIIYYELDDYIEIIHPNRGAYLGNRKISHLPWKYTIVFGKIDVIINTSFKNLNSIEYYIDGKLKAVTNIKPYSWTWDEKQFGSNSLKVVALDENKNILGSYELSNVWKLF